MKLAFVASLLSSQH